MSKALPDLLDTWNAHQVMHSCDRVCPSRHFYFDHFVRSQVSYSDAEMADFLADHPFVRISGRLQNSSDFRSTSEMVGIPVENGHDHFFEGLFTAEAIPQSPVRGAVEPAINEVDPSATDESAIILGQILATLNSMDASLAALVEYTKAVPVVVAIDPINGHAVGLVNSVRERLKTMLGEAVDE